MVAALIGRLSARSSGCRRAARLGTARAGRRAAGCAPPSAGASSVDRSGGRAWREGGAWRLLAGGGEKARRADGRRVDLVFLRLGAQRALHLVRQAALVAAALGLEAAQLDELDRKSTRL